MRTALQGVTPDAHADLTDDHLERITAMGYDGLTLHFGGLTRKSAATADPADIGATDRVRLRRMLEGHGLEFAYVWGYWAPLVAHDDERWERGKRLLAGAIALAHDVGSRFVVTGPGSNDERTGWYPHRANRSERSLERLVDAVRSVVPMAEEHDVTVSLKGHTLSALDTPETLARTVALVDSERVVGSVDPVNQMDVAHAFESRRRIDELMDRLGARARIAHAKDYRLDPGMVVSMPEVPLGTGWLDLPYYLARVDAVMTDPWLIVEHVDDAGQEAAAARLRTAMAAVGD